MLYGKDAIAYDKALKSLEQARVAVHYLATRVNGAYHNLEQGLYETTNAVREVQAALDGEETVTI